MLLVLVPCFWVSNLSTMYISTIASLIVGSNHLFFMSKKIVERITKCCSLLLMLLSRTCIKSLDDQYFSCSKFFILFSPCWVVLFSCIHPTPSFRILGVLCKFIWYLYRRMPIMISLIWQNLTDLSFGDTAGTIYKTTIIPCRTFCVVCSSPLFFFSHLIHTLIHIYSSFAWKHFHTLFVFSRLALGSQKLRLVYFLANLNIDIANILSFRFQALL